MSDAPPPTLVTATDLRAEHCTPALGIGRTAPRLSWRTVTDLPGWRQAAYEVEVDGRATGRVACDDSVLVAWPTDPLSSRQCAEVRVRVWGEDGSASPWSEPLRLEVGLLTADDWTSTWITPVARDPRDRPAPAPYLRRAFAPVRPAAELTQARLYVTSAGIHRVEINGTRVGDHVLAPGWSAYQSRLRYDTHDVTDLVRDGENVLGAVLADGWWRGYLTWDMRRNTYGDRLGLLAQLELSYRDGTVETLVSDDRWRTSTGPILAADLYQGQTHDARLELHGWSSPGFDDDGWGPVETYTPLVGDLVAPPGPPVRRIEELAVREVRTSPSGRPILDFGQNLVGWLRFTVEGPPGHMVTLRHAEVLEDGELAVAPLRNADAIDRYTLRGGEPETWEPEFTFHGFRYAEVDGWPGPLDAGAFTAVVVHSDMERTGTFSCSHELLNRLHDNVVWGMRGNFVDVPTDCPQRDERLGWTGDLQVFTPTASFLYDVSGVLESWLADLRAEQHPDGAVPVIVPAVDGLTVPRVAAGWSDAATVVPWELYQRYGDSGLLAEQLPSMRAWVDHITRHLDRQRLWHDPAFQFGDWLDPLAPESAPWQARTDRHLVATAYYACSARLVSSAAAALGQADVARQYGALAGQVTAAFREEYLTPNGRLMSDTAAAYGLALAFDLVTEPDDRQHLARNLARICAENFFTITTGFLGTPVVLPALSAEGRTGTAYRMLTQTERPSWLYPVTMGATTIWERWDSLLPDGRVNGSGMTSFNHYALGCVADWMHEVVGGLAPDAPGWRRLRVAPVPGPGVTSAEATLRTPYGHAACRWSLDGATVRVTVEVPPNTSAAVVRPGRDDRLDPLHVGSGKHEWIYEVADEQVARWRGDMATTKPSERGANGGDHVSDDGQRAGALAGAILDLEAERHAEETETILLPDDVLPGVGDEELTLREGLKIGGTFTFALLAVLVGLDELESAALGVLAPDIRDSLHVSSGAIVFISASAGAFLVLGSVPMGWLVDRFKRGPIIAWASLVFSLMVLCSGLALNAFQLFWARFGVGVAKSNQLPVHGSLLADTYPIGTRGRIAAGTAIAGRLSGTLSPLLVGGIAALAAGPAGWRWAFIILSVPAFVAALLAFRLPEPPRGQYEKLDVLGEVIEDEKPLPISMEAAFSRLLQIRTIRMTIIAFSAMGFGLFTVPVLSNLFLEQQYGLGSFGRGAVATTGGVAILCTIPFIGRYYDGLYRRDPSRALRLLGLVVMPAALLTPVQYFMPNVVLFALFGIPGAVLLSAAFAMIGPILISVVPYRLRGMGSALGAIYVFFVGATGGAVLSALLVNAYGPRVAVLALFVPSTIIGGFLIVRSAGFIKDDLSMIVAEIREELEEHERHLADPDTVPALQVNHIDFSYGQVQILFDVSFEVRRGEVLALLGTNGAGKSTILRVIAGLGTPARGVVRMNGRSITYVSPEQRTRLGIRMLPGGHGVFGDMTIRENLEMATFNHRSDAEEVTRRTDSVLELFPELADRPHELASALSGGQQQLLALARTLAGEPEILIIDELSLGLAPIMVERLVAIVDRLKHQGLTIIVVEQSLNVAQAISDRVVFLEKGHVRFEGLTAELVGRNDLARAVFLGAEGG